MTSVPAAAAIVAEESLPEPAEYGVRKLVAALEVRGWRCIRTIAMPSAEAAAAFVVVLPGSTGGAAEIRAQADLRLPEAAEALAFQPLSAESGQPATVVVAGGGARGLLYALLEAARRIELQGPSPADTEAGERLLALFPAAQEAPERRIRSLCVFPHHEVMEREWYRSLDFWRWYFDLLALHRFNRFTLTYGHQTAYLAPPYPFFVPVPEHPEVVAPSCTAERQRENLALLQAISRLAVERGLDFTLGVWSQHAYSYGEPTVAGLDKENLAAYCGAGIRRLLAACPDISAVQLRVNSESGIHLDEGVHFWRAIFEGVAACGRPVTLDLRAKGLLQDTIDAALATGLPVLADTKFWTEHQGLPYHATLLQEGDRYVRRHSYADQLGYPGGQPRPYDFLFQLWNLGTNRFLLWADPEWVRCFAATTTLGGAAGFEICAPLSNKGFGNRGPAWSVFADSSYAWYRWEQERYWPWFALFGRLGYSGAADPAAWQREWASRFGAAGTPALERALSRASLILPLLTASHSPSASVFGYWPEKDMGGVLDLFLQVDGSDVGMFASAQDTAAAGLCGTPDARRTPTQVGEELERAAAEATAALEEGLAAARPVSSAAERELRGLALDIRVQALLARYHAAKARAAQDLAWFYAAGDSHSLAAAKPAAAEALRLWQELVALTDGVYHDDLVFGRQHDQDGHWKDNLLYAQYDVERLEEVDAVFRRYGLFDVAFDLGGQLPPRTGTPPMPYVHDYSVERRFTGVGPQSLYGRQPGWGWGGTYGLVATEMPKLGGKALFAAQPNPAVLPREPLYADFVARHPAAPYDNGTFLVDLPNGTYDVTAILADRSAAPRDHGPMTVTFQARHRLGPVRVAAGEIVDLRQRVQVTAGRLTVEMSAPPQGDWLLSGLVISRAAPRLGHRPPPAVEHGERAEWRVTVTSADPLAELSFHYRTGEGEPFTTQSLPRRGAATDATPPCRPERSEGPGGPSTSRGLAVPHPDGSVAGSHVSAGSPIVVNTSVCVEVPADAPFVEYYFEAIDANGATATWPPEGAQAPRRVYAGRTGSIGRLPTFEHQARQNAEPAHPLPVVARVTAAAPLARVTLHYRNVNQMHTHDRLEMLPDGAPVQTSHGDWTATYGATIPGEHVSVEWDLMYHLEAVDVLGNAAFHPGLSAGTPYVVVPIRRAGSS